MTQVYFIQSEATQAIKIGISTDPQKRLAALQTANGDKLKLLGVTTEYSEADLHARFRTIRLNGEWFKPDLALLCFLVNLGMKPILPFDSPVRWFLSLPEVEHATGLNESMICHLMKKNHFPKPIWIDAEIAEWQNQRIAARDAKATAA